MSITSPVREYHRADREKECSLCLQPIRVGDEYMHFAIFKPSKGWVHRNYHTEPPCPPREIPGWMRAADEEAKR